MTRYKLLTGDVSGTPATYYTRGDSSSEFVVYEVNLWEDLDSSAIETHGKYNVQIGFVSIDDAERVTAALRSCGWEFDADNNIVCPHSGDTIAPRKSKHWPLVQVEAMWGYGEKSVVADLSGNNLRKLVRDARFEAGF